MSAVDEMRPLDGYFTREPGKWRGFAPLGEVELECLYSFSEAAGRALRGAQNCECFFRALPRPGFEYPFQFYFARGRLALIEVDYWSLDSDICRAVLADLGEPAVRIDAHLRLDIIPGADWVYPKSGLALCVAPKTGLIARWTAFAPGRLDDYCNRIRAIGRAREFERER